MIDGILRGIRNGLYSFSEQGRIETDSSDIAEYCEVN